MLETMLPSLSLEINDIYNDDIKSNTFTLESPGEIISVFNFDTNKLFIETNERFYGVGILENIINEKYNDLNSRFSDDAINISLNKIKKNNLANMEIYNISHYLESYDRLDNNWLLGYYIMTYMTNIQYSKFIKEITNNDLKMFILGNTKNNFVSGVYSYIQHNKINLTIDWLSYNSASINNANKNINRILKKKEIKPISKYDLKYNNITNLKMQVENKFNKVNIVFSNINPITNIKALILNIILCISILTKHGLCIVKIKSPHIWKDFYKSYIQLYSMFFYSVKIIKFPVCKNKKYFYEYFLLAHSKKKVIYEDELYKKLMVYYLSDDIKTIKYKIDDDTDIYTDIDKLQIKMIDDNINLKTLYNIIESLI